MANPRDYSVFLNDRGTSLSALGIEKIALIRDEALFAVQLLRVAGLPILGGDAYFRRNGKIEIAYANWFTDLNPGESKEAYAQRSWDTAQRYIVDFPKQKTGEVLFALVTPRH